jgi:hypothetical protein
MKNGRKIINATEPLLFTEKQNIFFAKLSIQTKEVSIQELSSLILSEYLKLSMNFLSNSFKILFGFFRPLFIITSNKRSANAERSAAEIPCPAQSPTTK